MFDTENKVYKKVVRKARLKILTLLLFFETFIVILDEFPVLGV